MATTTLFSAFIFNTTTIPAGQAQGYQIGPDARLGSGTVTATAHGLSGLVSGSQILNVEILKTRAGQNDQLRFLDITVRNIAPNSCPFVKLFVHIVTP
ncbi:hypothetical protein [Streptomyces avidinii]|uniref:ML domain-containing protein n=1 Tax=Streptomyces avidinii TaxID=1895 RepID=A0ABS4KXZ0_STRAV|nr:hypothetical protein [Streptomyces avidinii]MBP2034236.1 hypothetical protein [Streptomyces avidinii]GGZ35153.1 hypothetical protein GCM10010343_73030 [Streptomyces avidinii]